jgi:polysaccharide biosynthesis transport protein
MADHLRTKVPTPGTRLLVTSPKFGDERHAVVAHLAAAMGQRGERVVIIDAEVREPRAARGLEFLSPVAEEVGKGIGDLLAGDRIPLGELVVKTTLPGVVLLPRGKAIGAPEALGGPRMREVLQEATQHASLVLVAGAPVMPVVDTELLARTCDGVILAARSGRTKATDLKRAAKRLESCGAPLLGVVLVDVPRAFLDID